MRSEQALLAAAARPLPPRHGERSERNVRGSGRAKEVLREIDKHLAWVNDDAVRRKVKSAIELINQYEITERRQGQLRVAKGFMSGRALGELFRREVTFRNLRNAVRAF